MLDGVLDLLTGTGLAASAGLNAYLPLLAVGVLARYTDLISPPAGWQWLANGWVIAILCALLAIEVVADKIPAVDSVNDAIHTVIRPTAGGLAFGAAAGSRTLTVRDPGQLFAGRAWVPVVAGVVIALAVHLVKAGARPVINASTLGLGGPVVSVVEDVASAATSVVAIVLPVLVVLFVPGMVVALVWWRRRRARRRGARAAERGAGRPGTRPGTRPAA